LRHLALSLKEYSVLFLHAQPRFARKSFLKEKKESRLGVGGGWLSSFFEKILPGYQLAVALFSSFLNKIVYKI